MWTYTYINTYITRIYPYRQPDTFFLNLDHFRRHIDLIDTGVLYLKNCHQIVIVF